MKRTFIIFWMVCLLSISALSLQAQAGLCGTTGDLQEAFIPDLRTNIRTAESNPVRFRSTQYLPIKFHIVTETDGTNGVKVARILDQLAALNEDFADLDIQFYLKDCSFNYINNSTVYENHEVTTGTIMRANRDDDAINVFIPETANRSNSTTEGRILGYYLKIAITGTGAFESDWLVVRKSEITSASITLTHELGHFFTLAHPHRGWESEPYDPEIHGNPAPRNSPAGIPTEMQDRNKNCDSAGDLLCDTPPDYNFGFNWTDCDYDGGAMDPDGDLVEPEEKLYMSYFSYCDVDDYFFSPMQKAAIIASANSAERAYIRSGWTPTEVEITTNTTLEAPFDDEELGYYNDVPFSWTAVPGATKYLLEISRFPDYRESTSTFIFEVNGNSKVVSGLDANKLYFWRVRPYNCYDTNTPFTSSNSFRTGDVTKTEEPGFIEGWTVSPNPVHSNASLQLSINSREAFEGQVVWYGLDGRRIRSEAG
ncbi:MAG: hypothetical protein KDD15_32910, partial [Lewinella sp.]|nr:hypothetical protein [Lewinella sp.]